MYNNQLLALILRANTTCQGIEFYTDDDSPQQIGTMAWPEGHIIVPHVHRLVERTISHTQEVLVIQKGKVRVDFYDDQQNYLESRILVTGDIIHLSSGGHGFTMLEDSVMVEIKQGPYVGERDKVRFDPIKESELNIKA
jgi:hypothetical protein